MPYSVEYVQRLREMVCRHYDGPHQFVCLTDRASDVAGFVDRAIPIRPMTGLAGWWSKIELFNPKHEIFGRVVSLDLDVLVVDDLKPIVEYEAEFALVPDGGTFKGKAHLKVVKKYNSSVMVWSVNDKMHRLHRLWTPDTARRLWGDQDYIGQMLPFEEVMPIAWFPRLSELHLPPEAAGEDARTFFLDKGARVILSKKPKNLEAAATLNWFNDLWRAA